MERTHELREVMASFAAFLVQRKSLIQRYNPGYRQFYQGCVCFNEVADSSGLLELRDRGLKVSLCYNLSSKVNNQCKDTFLIEIRR